MQNIIDFIWRNHFVFLFLLLEFISFSILVQFNKFQNSSFLSSVNEISGGVYDVVSNVTDYFELKRVNAELAAENARLKSVSKNAFIKRSGDLVFINDTIHVQQYRYLQAKVINNSVNKRNNIILLNQGNKMGVEEGMGVITDKGVVGIVKKVSENYCSVISLLSGKTQISGQLKKNRFFGILTWDENDNAQTATFSDIPIHVKLTVGDTITTRGSSTIFPSGQLIGFVNSFEPIPGSNFYNIKVKLANSFQSLSYCYIVRNLLKDEQLELEKLSADDQ